jgi:hypothetical protein
LPQVHLQQLEARARLEVAKQRLRQSEELLVKQTLQTGEAAREKRIRRQRRKAAAAAAAAAAEAALDLRASQAATSCTVAGVWPCLHACCGEQGRGCARELTAMRWPRQALLS